MASLGLVSVLAQGGRPGAPVRRGGGSDFLVLREEKGGEGGRVGFGCFVTGMF